MKKDINRDIAEVKVLNEAIWKIEAQRDRMVERILNDYGITYDELVAIWGD